MPRRTATPHRRRVKVAAGMTAGSLPPFIGIRIKPMSKELHARSLRTLDIFVTTLVKSAKRLPPNFAVTATKVMTPAHVSAVAQKCSLLEKKLKLRRNAIQLELMIETPQAIVAPDGRVALPALVNAGNGRVRGAHFGVYDYTALCGITAAWQHPRHLACDFAREMMRVVAGADRRDDLRRLDEHPADPATRADRLETTLRRRHACARQRLLPGVGSASGTPADASCRGRRVLSFRAPCRDGAVEQLLHEGGPGGRGV
jgi:hypothetical protein